MRLLSSLCCCFKGPPKSYISHHPVEDDYDILECVGEGKTGKVYRARHRATGEVAAVKQVMRSYLLSEQRNLAINREIDILGAIDHKNIIKLFHVYMTEESISVVTELAVGGEAMERLQDPFLQICERDISNVIGGVAAALAYLHSKGIIHRDVKPENIMFSSEDLDEADVKLVDFGVSYRGRLKPTNSNETVGTVHYLAPEVFTRDTPQGTELDIWALGVTMYVMLFGEYPFDGKMLYQIEDNIVACNWKLPEHPEIKISASAADLLAKMLVVDRRQRWTAAQVLQHPWITQDASTERWSSEHAERLRKYVRIRSEFKASDLMSSMKQSHNSFSAPAFSGAGAGGATHVNLDRSVAISRPYPRHVATAQAPGEFSNSIVGGQGGPQTMSFHTPESSFYSEGSNFGTPLSSSAPPWSSLGDPQFFRYSSEFSRPSSLHITNTKRLEALAEQDSGREQESYWSHQTVHEEEESKDSDAELKRDEKRTVAAS